jgi:hypothetical protein
MQGVIRPASWGAPFAAHRKAVLRPYVVPKFLVREGGH